MLKYLPNWKNERKYRKHFKLVETSKIRLSLGQHQLYFVVIY